MKDVDRLNELCKRLKDENDKLKMQNQKERSQVIKYKQCLKDIVNNVDS